MNQNLKESLAALRNYADRSDNSVHPSDVDVVLDAFDEMRTGLVGSSVEPCEQIREYCRMMAEFAPDVQSGDETFEDVFETLLDAFRAHGRDVLQRAKAAVPDSGTDPGSDGFCKNPGLP